MELLQNGLQPNSGVTLFVSIEFNESYIASIIAALTLMLGVNGSLGRKQPLHFELIFFYS